MKISVIVPVYNVENYIEDCILSIMRQTFNDFEVIIINDGTKDDSIKKIEKIIEENENIYLFNKENEGLSAARNTGLTKAKGDYVCFIDSDDWIEQDFLKKLYEQVLLVQPDVVCSGHKKVYDNGDIEIRGFSSELVGKGVITGEEALLYQLKNKCLRVEVWDDLYKREFLLKNNLKFEPGYLHEDEIFTPQVLFKAKSVVFINNNNYCYRQRANSIMNTKKTVFHAKSLKKIAEELVSYTDLTNNFEFKMLLAKRANMMYFWSIEIDKKQRLSKENNLKLYSLLKENKSFKDYMTLKLPFLVTIFSNIKKTVKKVVRYKGAY